MASIRLPRGRYWGAHPRRLVDRQLIGAADQSANSLANVAENIGTDLDVSA